MTDDDGSRVLILGSGIAGLTTAVALAELGFSATLVTAAESPLESNTVYAQGGIIYEAASRDSEALVEDILEAGGGTNYLPAVRLLAKEGPRLVEKWLLQKAKVPFDRTADRLHLVREGAHREARILHRGDATGRSIQESLLAYAQTLPGLQFLTHSTAVELLLTSEHANSPEVRRGGQRCFGACLFDRRRGEIYAYRAARTVLATGGIGQLYLHHTNGVFARGDGLALADRAGCRLDNLEFVQFHPTAFYRPGMPRFLISESARGEGAVLVNAQGERFLAKFMPHCAEPELQSRDKVARGIVQELSASGAECVFLDFRGHSAAWFEERFPTLVRNCRAGGIDPVREPIPVVPAAHYHCGGVWTDLDARTSLAGLWAVGEVASTGLHGGNRLASTSLLEGLVWGTRAAVSIAAERRQSFDVGEARAGTFWGRRVVDPARVEQDRLTLKQTMWNYAGLVKSEPGLARAASILGELFSAGENFYRGAEPTEALIGLRHGVRAGLRIVEASLRRRESHGCFQWEKT